MSMYTETLIILSLMVVTFVIAMRIRLSSTLAMMLTALVGAVWSVFQDGAIEVIAQYIEGSFFLFNIALVVFCSSLFIEVIRRNGALGVIVQDITKVLGKHPILLLTAMTLVVVFPGAVTGSGTAAVMATGGLVGSVLMQIGIPIENTAAIVAFAGMMGMTAPPVNIPAMIISEGVVMPYIGFTWPLFVLTIPTAIISSIILGYPHIRKNRDKRKTSIDTPSAAERGVKAYIGLIVLVIMLAATRMYPHSFPVLGLPLIFLISAISAFIVGRKINPVKDLLDAFFGTVDSTLPVIGILLAAGSLIQMMSLTGVRGLIVAFTITLSPILLYMTLCTIFPLIGGVLTSFGAASVIGVPIVLSFMGKNSILVASAVSSIGGLGVLIPPTAIVGAFAAKAVGYDGSYLNVLRKLALPWIIVITISVLMIVYAKNLLFLI